MPSWPLRPDPRSNQASPSHASLRASDPSSFPLFYLLPPPRPIHSFHPSIPTIPHAADHPPRHHRISTAIPHGRCSGKELVREISARPRKESRH
ncbi:hypothetical protein ABZP36_006583 [Zizania latifolia]